jgi:molybdopterin/thiamine biosynthesis adenylyltransferase
VQPVHRKQSRPQNSLAQQELSAPPQAGLTPAQQRWPPSRPQFGLSCRAAAFSPQILLSNPANLNLCFLVRLAIPRRTRPANRSSILLPLWMPKTARLFCAAALTSGYSLYYEERRRLGLPNSPWSFNAMNSKTSLTEAIPTESAQIEADSPTPTLPALHTSPISDHDRYSRQILFPGIGAAGQQRLASSHVAIVGCGATGAATASLLARAGVGTLTLIDRDFVEPSNLQRQVLFDESDALDSLPKAEAARRKIALFNSTITVHPRIADLVPDNIDALLSPAHLILDATDNFETRYLINDYAVLHSTPWIYAAAIGAYAATMNILPQDPASAKEDCHSERSEEPPHLSFGAEQSSDVSLTYTPTACLACIFPKPPSGPVETCDTSGILSTAVNLAASLQVTEALKLLTGQPHLMRRTLLSFDLWSTGQNGSIEKSEISASIPRPGCTVCGDRVFSHLAGEGRPHITLCGRNSVQIHERHRPIDLAAMRDRLALHSDIHDVRANGLLLRFRLRRSDYAVTLFSDGRAIVQGTTDITLARSLYARFIGS